MRQFNLVYLRSFLFGVEDSLVSTAGLVAGMSAGANNKEIVLMAGLIAVFIEAVSMGAGEYLSDDAVHELNGHKQIHDNSMVSGAVMFSAYLFAGLIPLSPIALFQFPQSVFISAGASLIGLFILGYVKGKVVKINPIKSALKILIVGGIATALGVAVGLIFRV